MEQTFSGVAIHPRVIDILDRHGRSPREVAEVVTSPEATFPALNGRSTVYLGAEIAAIVDDDTGEVVALASAEQARRRRRQPRQGAVPRARGTGCGTRFPSTVADLLDRARAAGLRVDPPSGRHLRIRHPHGGPVVTVPATPSDRRSIPNAVLTIRQTLGVDLRQVS